MSRRAVRVHRDCGTRLPNRDVHNYCPACRKWLVGDSIHLVSLATGRVIG